MIRCDEEACPIIRIGVGQPVGSFAAAQGALRLLQTEGGVAVVCRESAVERAHQLRGAGVFDRPMTGDDLSGAAALHECAQPFDCFTGGGKVAFYKPGSFTPFSYDFDVNNDGTLQTPLGVIRKMGN
jgi:hypothetical protein